MTVRGQGEETFAEIVERLAQGRPLDDCAGCTVRLADGTIRENVLFSRPDATAAEMLEACRIARVDEFAENLENGYDTIVGERGVKLSGGQRQRLSIARAILADPRILILDEATSSHDFDNEKRILDAIERLQGRATVLLIAHRVSAIQRAEIIYVLENGRVAESGDWQSLSNKPSTRVGSLFRLQDALA